MEVEIPAEKLKICKEHCKPDKWGIVEHVGSCDVLYKFYELKKPH